MNNTIWKFKIPTISENRTVMAPRGCKWLSVQTQGNDHIANTVAWAECDPTAELVPHTLAFFSTGHDVLLTSQHHYLGTVQYEGGALVFHVYLFA